MNAIFKNFNNNVLFTHFCYCEVGKCYLTKLHFIHVLVTVLFSYHRNERGITILYTPLTLKIFPTLVGRWSLNINSRCRGANWRRMPLARAASLLRRLASKLSSRFSYECRSVPGPSSISSELLLRPPFELIAIDGSQSNASCIDCDESQVCFIMQSSCDFSNVWSMKSSSNGLFHAFIYSWVDDFPCHSKPLSGMSIQSKFYSSNGEL